MYIDNTLMVEITGVFGAGHVPGLLQHLKVRLDGWYRRRTAKGARKLNALYCIDNTEAVKADSVQRNRIDCLIQKGSGLQPAELIELEQGLTWMDEVVFRFIDRPKRPIDIVLRRGGSLQTFALLRHGLWKRFNAERILQPKSSIFVTAPFEVIKATYADTEFRNEFNNNRSSYCPSPDDALKLQREWLRNVSILPGVYTVVRESPDLQSLSDALLNKLLELLKPLGSPVIPWLRMFISYSSLDRQFSDLLYSRLRRYDVDCWYAPESLRTSDEYRDTFPKKIAERDALIVVVSENSLHSDWVKFEVTTALALERKYGRPRVFPVRMDGCDLAGVPWTVPLAGRHTCDFIRWQDSAAFDDAFNRLLGDLLDYETERRSQVTGP